MKQTNLQKAQVRLREKFIKNGVKMSAPETVYFSKDTKIGKNVIIEPYVVFGSKVRIGNNVTIKSFSHLEDCRIESKVDVGPYARIRPGTILKEGSKVGNFVEIKKSIIGKAIPVRPNKIKAIKAIKAPIIKISPWAKLIIPIIP